MDWTVFDWAPAAVLLAAAVLLVWRAVRRPGGLVARALTLGVGGTAIVAGELDDAPGLVLFGALVIAATLGVMVHAVQRRSSS